MNYSLMGDLHKIYLRSHKIFSCKFNCFLCETFKVTFHSLIVLSHVTTVALLFHTPLFHPILLLLSIYIFNLKTRIFRKVRHCYFVLIALNHNHKYILLTFVSGW